LNTICIGKSCQGKLGISYSHQLKGKGGEVKKGKEGKKVVD